MCDKVKLEAFRERSKKEQSAKKISRCARNDGGGMGLFHVAYNGYVWKALFPYRHPERSRGIFLAHRYSAVCVIAEKGKTFAKGARKNRVQGGFLDCARNDGMGMDGSPYAPCLIIIPLIEFIYAFFARFL